MLMPLMSLLAAALARLSDDGITCKVGRAALRDLPGIHNNHPDDSCYNASDGRRRDLLDVCPKLKAKFSTGYSGAKSDAHTIENIHVPVAGFSPRFVSIYSIDVCGRSRRTGAERRIVVEAV
jgi:hypothetical protein